MKKGLTLLELMIVIGIIAVLMTVLLSVTSGGTESARAALCLSNLKNLASAVQSAASIGTGQQVIYPTAGSYEVFSSDASEGTDNVKDVFYDIPGWISWYSKGAYPANDQSASSSWTVSMYDTSEDRREFALTNGSIWVHTHCSRSVYLCPTHARKMKDSNPFFSYVMNAAFWWESDPGEALHLATTRMGLTDMTRAERRLLFAEIPFSGVCVEPSTARSGYDTDAILQFKGCEKSGSFDETIGFNHETGHAYHAHVVFQDGHVEKLAYPKNGLTKANVQDLTAWLCRAKDVSYDGSSGKYINLED